MGNSRKMFRRIKSERINIYNGPPIVPPGDRIDYSGGYL